MKKLLYIHQYFATPDCDAGTRSYEMAKRMIRAGWDVEFITSTSYMNGAREFSPGWNYFEIDGIKVNAYHIAYSNKTPFLKRMLIFLKFSFFSTLKIFSKKTPLVFATSTPLTVIIPAFVHKVLFASKIVFEVRDLWPELPVAVGAIKNPLLIWAAKLLERFCYFVSHEVVALSPGMKDGVEKIARNNLEVTTIPNSCDVALFDVPKTQGESYRVEKNIPEGQKMVVYTGSFGLINRVGYLVGVAQASKALGHQISYHCYGRGMEFEKVQKMAADAGVLDQNFFLMGSVPKTEIVSALSAADLALSLFGPVKQMWHNSANKLFDAMASGTPLAINYLGWQADFISKRKAGILLDMEDQEKAAVTIHNFLHDSEKYALSVSAVRELAREEFSRDKLAEKLIEVLERVHV